MRRSAPAPRSTSREPGREWKPAQGGQASAWGGAATGHVALPLETVVHRYLVSSSRNLLVLLSSPGRRLLFYPPLSATPPFPKPQTLAPDHTTDCSVPGRSLGSGLGRDSLQAMLCFDETSWVVLKKFPRKALKPISAMERSICLHAFSDLSHVPPATFIYLLKDYYAYGTSKATSKFKILLQLVKAALHNGPQPGPFTYAVQCMYIVPLLGKTYSEGFSHMLTSSLKHLKSVESVKKDFLEAKHLAAQLILDILDSVVPHENRILVKLLETFEIELRDMAHALYGSELDGDLVKAREHLRQYVKCFMESESNAIAVALITRFSIECCDESFLIKLIESNQLDIAEECATFMGKEMISLVIQKYLDMKMLKSANKLVKEHDLTEEFPDVSYLYKESLVKKLAEKGCWDIAEVRAKKETKLMEYLVYLAMEAGYMEKVDELCQRYSLDGYVHSLVPEKVFCGSDYLDLKKLDVEEIVWVDEINDLLNATSCIEGFKIIGMDCEWRPNFEKNSKPSKVSIIQIASDKIAFIFDLIKLYEDNPKVLDSCFGRIMCSSNILKLGYDIQCDLHQLTQSYGELECFQSYERLLDMQKLFKWVTGGLSGLSKEILGLGLNKTRRNSNWEQRPLSQNQKEYAALDAVVLVHIFHEHIRRQPQFGVSEGCKAELKSHVVSRVNSARRPLRF